MNEKTTEKQSEVRPAQPVKPRYSSLDKLKEWDPKGAELLLRTGNQPMEQRRAAAQGSRADLSGASLRLHEPRRDGYAPPDPRRARRGRDARRGFCVLKCAAWLWPPIRAASARPFSSRRWRRRESQPPAVRSRRPRRATRCGRWASGTRRGTRSTSFPRSGPKILRLRRTGIYKSGIFTPRFIELISIAFDASITHMYAPGMRRHIKGALKAGATPEEIMTVLQICVSMGVQACAKGVPILAEELERREPWPALSKLRDWTKCPRGRGAVVSVADKDVTLFDVDGTIYPIEDDRQQLYGKRPNGWVDDP